MRYARCPKCGHSPLPADQSLPAACAGCGLILAKWGAELPRRKVPADAEAASGLSRAREWLFYVPERVSSVNWTGRALALAVLSAWTLWIWYEVSVPRGEVGSNFLHMVLLPFHEAGHYFLFRWFGPFIMTLGGTLGQHLLPIVAGVALLWKHRNPFGAALCFWLLGFSTIDMAIYMYDAFDPKLMLLGGKTGQESDGHDWQNLFGDMGLLKRARGIGQFFGVVGMAMMAAGLAWAAYVLKLQHAKRSASPMAEVEEAEG